MKQKSLIIYTIPLILWTLLMVTVSSLPGSQFPETGLLHVDKLAHSGEFFIFTLLLYRYLYFVKKMTHRTTAFGCLLFGFVYAALDEIHQLLIPNRSCTWQDFIADTLGIIIGVCCMAYYLKRKITR